MAKTFVQLQEAADLIKNETADGANTAERVGGTMRDIVDKMQSNEELAQTTGNSKTTAMSQDAVTKELTELDKVYVTTLDITTLKNGSAVTSEQETEVANIFDTDKPVLCPTAGLYTKKTEDVWTQYINCEKDGILYGASINGSNWFIYQYDIRNKAFSSGYVECTTGASTAAKTITVTGMSALSAGIRLLVKMSNKNTATNATLNINSLGAKPLYYNNERVSGDNAWSADEVVEVYYDGTNFYSSNVLGGASGGGGNMILEWNTDASTTRKQVKAKDRKAGLQISYLNPDNGWVNEQYIGSLFTDAEWVKDNNWSKITSEKELEGIYATIISTIGDNVDFTPINGEVNTDGSITEKYPYYNTGKIQVYKNEIISVKAKIYAVKSGLMVFNSDGDIIANYTNGNGVVNDETTYLHANDNWSITVCYDSRYEVEIIKTYNVKDYVDDINGNLSSEITAANAEIQGVKDETKLVRSQIAYLKQQVNHSDLFKIKVAQYNVGHFAGGKANPNIPSEEVEAKSLEWRKYINDIGADVFCCSEYDPYFDKEQQHLAQDIVFGCYKNTNIGDKRSYSCNAIFDNVFFDVIQKTTFNFSTVAGRYMQLSVAKIMGEDVYVGSCHLEFDPNPDIESGENKTQVEQLADFFRDKKYVILCGDFNVKKDEYWQILKDAGFTLANDGALGIIRTEPNSAITHTTGNVDNICVKGFSMNKIWFEGFKSDKDETESGLSDHCVVTAELIFQKLVYAIFSDQAAKKVFVQNWDTNGDGEITYDELANITSITTQFQNNTEIENLNDLSLIPNITNFGSSFAKGMTSLRGIVFPSSITSAVRIGASTENRLENLKYVMFLQGDGSKTFFVDNGAFQFIKNLETIDFPQRFTRMNFFGFDQIDDAKNRVKLIIRKDDGIATANNPNKNFIKYIFVPQSLVSAYQADSNWSSMEATIAAIGGTEWVEEYGSSDEYADYTYYNLDDYIGK